MLVCLLEFGGYLPGFNVYLLPREVNMVFQIGDKAVYPAHGVGVIRNIEHKEIAGNTHSFYIMEILSNGMTIMVPTQTADTVGLRKIINEKEVIKVYDILKDRNVKVERQTWNRRFRDYHDKIKTGSVYEIAKVLRDLYILKHTKQLSFGAKKMFDTARNLIVKEISIAKQTDESAIEEEVNGILSPIN